MSHRATELFVHELRWQPRLIQFCFYFITKPPVFLDIICKHVPSIAFFGAVTHGTCTMMKFSWPQRHVTN